MQVHHGIYTLKLEEEPMDIGYASEKVTLYDEHNKVCVIAGHNGKTQLIFSVPFITKTLKEELEQITSLLSAEGELEQYLVVANESHQNPHIESLNFRIDKEGEFGDWYGVRLQGEVLSGEFTKSLILISKDGAIFYDEYPKDINQKFNHDMLLRKVAAAQTCYTGKGCH